MNFEQNFGFKSDLMDWLIIEVTGNSGNASAAFTAILKLGLWKDAAPKLLELKASTFEVRLEFQSHWLTSGHRIREQIISDSEISALLKHMMPKYDGGDKVLYRGERKWNWDNGRIGLCWTDKMVVAENFAAGLHNSEDGAVVIRGNFPACGVIAGPEPMQRHPIRDEEREFTIDPLCDVLVEAIKCHEAL